MIYLDNAATSWPKPVEVAQAMADSLTSYGANPGRGGHSFSLKTARMVMSTRQQVAEFFGSSNPDRWVFTSSATDSCNIALQGYLEPGDHVIASAWEHNAIARPLHLLAQRGVEVTYLDGNSVISAAELTAALQKNTKMVVINHASNVTGVVQPIEELRRAIPKGVSLMLDVAQTAGLFEINVEDLGVDLLVVPGHKGLYGPAGIGMLYVGSQVHLKPLRVGGTGSKSESLEQPSILPDALESGTINVPGIAGLAAGLGFVRKNGVANILEHEWRLADRLVKGLREVPGVQIYGWGENAQAPVVSFSIRGVDSSEIGLILDQSFSIAARAGLHCSPLAHRALGTLNIGVVRFSIGYFNTENDIEMAIDAVTEIAAELDGGER